MALRIAQRYGKPEKRSKSSEAKRELTQKLSYVILDLICSYIVLRISLSKTHFNLSFYFLFI